MYIGDILGRRTIYSPEALAVVDAGQSPHRRFTYRELNERANRLADWLRTYARVGKGDRVAILAHDGVEYLDAFFACGKLGAILVCLNWRLQWRELLALMNDTIPKAILYSVDLVEVVMRVNLAGPSPVPVLRLGDNTALQSTSPAPIVTEDLTEEDIACLIFTGGTTGQPRGAKISHRMIAWNTLNTIIHDLTHGDVTINTLPMFHTGGLLVYTMPLLILGGTVVLTRRFDPAQTLDLIQEYRATVFAAVPIMYQMMTAAPNWATADLSSLRFCTSGGAPLPVPLVEKFRDEKGVCFKQGFGMSEFGPGIFALAPEDALRKAGSIGRPNFFVDARIVDDENHPLAAGEIGELALRGPSRSSGYFSIAPDQADLDNDGWFHTGDLAYYDDDWYFYIVDRKKDMFISGGENIYPAEIEQALYKHPAVQLCAVISVPDTQWGEVGKACVVLKPETVTTPEELIQHMKRHLARYKVPKSVEMMESLPMSGAGKVLKRELRERFNGSKAP